MSIELQLWRTGFIKRLHTHRRSYGENWLILWLNRAKTRDVEWAAIKVGISQPAFIQIFQRIQCLVQFHRKYVQLISGNGRVKMGNFPDFGMKSGLQVAGYPCAFVLNSNETKMGHIHSPNFPGFYPRNTECHYFFYGNANEKVHLHFNYFDVEGVLP